LLRHRELRLNATGRAVHDPFSKAQARWEAVRMIAGVHGQHK